jgi:ribosomal protein S18 acetylase RimI-like enzyme
MPGAIPPPTVRARTTSDLDACVALASEVHLLDGYPSFLGDGGFTAFVTPDDALGAWVAEDGADLVGHVMLRPRSAPPSVELAAQVLGAAPDRLGFVARLMVAPRARRRGVARRLLDVAVGEARRLNRVAVLDVVARDTAAVTLYEASGWIRLGEVSFALRSGEQLPLHVFAWPQ